MERWRETILSINDPLVRQGIAEAVQRTLSTAATEKPYPGFYSVTADGRHFGEEISYPGLDWWEMAGAYLRVGRADLVRNSFDFVRTAQRSDGNIPFVVMPAEPPPNASTYFRGLKYPQDIFEFAGRKWIGLFEHWQPRSNPLKTLAATSIILTAGEYHQATNDREWLAKQIDAVDRAADFLRSLLAPSGLVSGAGFYTEMPPRHGFDGVTQCYVAHAWRELSRLHGICGSRDRAQRWQRQADALSDNFRQIFWRGDHFAEYVHPERGLIDTHGLSDVNLAAIGLNIASDMQAIAAWERIVQEPRLWAGGMPTQAVADPHSYEPWEYNEPLDFVPAHTPIYDASAMGRVWYLDALAAARMGDTARLVESVRLVCQCGQQSDWRWHERYAVDDGRVRAVGPHGYCEYAAILIRVVFDHLHLFTAAVH